MKGELYIVATPIGNLNEMPPRGVETLKKADMILCEDTRHSAKLLNHFDIKTQTSSYHKFTEAKNIPEIIAKINAGTVIALITDAGMPTVSDPGSRLVEACYEADIKVYVISGPSAVINAAAMSGMCEKGFTFIGFLPEKSKDKEEIIDKVGFLGIPIIIYCAPHNLQADLKFLNGKLGSRKTAVIREMTKLYEEIRFLDLSEYDTVTPKGEYVLVVEGKEKENINLNLSAEEHLKNYLDSGMDTKTAIKAVAAERGVQKNEIYQLALKIESRK